MRKILLTIACLLTSLVLWAGNVTEQEALRKAQQFMQGKTFVQPAARRSSAAPTFADGAFYVFNIEQKQGFVIVSADDRTPSILGYSDKGSLDINDLPVNARAWLEGYAQAIKKLPTATASAYAAQQTIWGAPISPMVTCKWNQNSPYNMDCPEVKDSEGVKMYAPTGCAATAMAQLMYYHKLETKTQTIPAYTTEKEKIQLEALPPYAFQWSKMLNEYQEGDKSEGAKEVAKLMRYCGQAIKMDYTSEMSGGFPTAEAFINLFGFSNQSREVLRKDYTPQEWDKMVYDELTNKRPVLYYGSAVGGPHEFVIDGYDDKGLFHVNWGWGGQSDGYFVLSLLNPYTSKDITGIISDQGYSNFQRAIIGIEKPKEGEVAVLQKINVYPSWPKEKEDKKDEYARNSILYNFENVAFSYKVCCPDLKDGETVTVDYALNVYQNGSCVMQLPLAENQQLTKEYKSVNGSVSFGENMQDGSYEIHLVCRKQGTEKWLVASSEGESENNGYSRTYVAEILENTKLQLFPYWVGTDKEFIEVKNVTISPYPMKGRVATINLQCTNKNYDSQVDLYLFIKSAGTRSNDEEGNPYNGELSLYLGHDQTATGTFWFTPKVSGSFDFFISSDQTGVVSLYDGQIVIAEPTQQKLEAKMTINNLTEDGIVNTTTVTGKAEVKNNGNNDYKDYIAVSLMGIDDQGEMVGDNFTGKEQELILASKDTKEIPFEFNNLIPGQRYQIYISYYSAAQTGEDKDGIHYSVPVAFTVSRSATGIVGVAVDELGTGVQYYSLDGRQLSGPQQGINIVRMPNGTTRKVVVY